MPRPRGAEEWTDVIPSALAVPLEVAPCRGHAPALAEDRHAAFGRERHRAGDGARVDGRALDDGDRDDSDDERRPRHAANSGANQQAYALAEAGLNNALSVLAANYPGSVVFPGDPNLLPLRTTTYESGTATWSGSLVPVTDAPWTWQWNVSSVGTVRSPIGGGAEAVSRRGLDDRVRAHSAEPVDERDQRAELDLRRSGHHVLAVRADRGARVRNARPDAHELLEDQRRGEEDRGRQEPHALDQPESRRAARRERSADRARRMSSASARRRAT